jgi:hypothetical protein
MLEELKFDHEMDTLGRWMAHYLAEKIERATVAPEGEAGEPDRHECADLILRLWEHRQTWPLSAPLKDVADRLDELLAPKPSYFHSATKKSKSFMDLLHGLEELHHREAQVCLAAWVAGLSLSKDREFLLSHSEHLDDNELKITQRLVEIQDLMLSPEAHLDGEPCPSFATQSKSEQGKVVRARLRAIAKSRTQLLSR